MLFLWIGNVGLSYGLNFESVKQKYLPLVNATNLNSIATNSSEFKQITHGYHYSFETAIAKMTYLQNGISTLGAVDMVYFLHVSDTQSVDKTLVVTIDPNHKIFGTTQYSPWNVPIWYPLPAMTSFPYQQNHTEQKIDINKLVNIVPPAPLEQVKNGVISNDVDCFQGIQSLELIFKAEDKSPACVRDMTANYLIKRGWAMNQPNDESINLFAEKPSVNVRNETITVTMILDIKIDNAQKLSPPLSVVTRYTNGTIYQIQQISMNTIPLDGNYKYNLSMTSTNPDDIFGYHQIDVIHNGNTSQISVDITK